MRAKDVKIGDWVEMKEESKRYGYMKVAGIILANKDHSENWKFVGYEKVPYITIMVEHYSSSKKDTFGLFKRLRPRDLQKEHDKLGKYRNRNIYTKISTGNQYTIVDYSKGYITATENNEYFTINEKEFLKQFKEVR